MRSLPIMREPQGHLLSAIARTKAELVLLAAFIEASARSASAPETGTTSAAI